MDHTRYTIQDHIEKTAHVFNVFTHVAVTVDIYFEVLMMYPVYRVTNTTTGEVFKTDVVGEAARISAEIIEKYYSDEVSSN